MRRQGGPPWTIHSNDHYYKRLQGMSMKRLVLDPSTAMVDHRGDSDQPPPLVLHVSQAQNAYPNMATDLSRGWGGSQGGTSVRRWSQGQISSEAIMLLRRVTLEELEEVRVMHQLTQAVEEDLVVVDDEPMEVD
jgi:hypothetical protein